jgi:hypothetical protein
MRALATVVIAVSCLALPADAANFFEKQHYLHGRDYDRVVPVCAEPEVAKRIAERFTRKEAEYWNSSLMIVAFTHARQLGLEPWGTSYIPRRYCSAQVTLSDGQKTTVYYAIGEDLGMAGHSWGVEWCVMGKDRNFAYAPGCRMARP